MYAWCVSVCICVSPSLTDTVRECAHLCVAQSDRHNHNVDADLSAEVGPQVQTCGFKGQTQLA